MVICKCGTECPQGRFCFNCGTALDNVDQLRDCLANVTLGAESGGTPFENKIFSLQRQSGDDINLVLLGRSGVGKSTWVNSFVNFLKHNSFEDALGGPVYAPIFSQFHHADQDSTAEEITQRLVTISLGKRENLCDEYAVGNVSASATAMPMCHRVEPRNGSYGINLIDTPGVKATSGNNADNYWRAVQQVDRGNLDTILNHISQYDYINAFIILLKPDEEKLDPAFTYSLQILFSQLHESARNNVVFAFTHANYCNFDDTKTVLVLDGYLKQIGLDIKITRSNVFYFDSTPFRYLATRSKNYRPKEDHFIVRRCWQRSVQSCENLINYVDKLPPHNTYSTVLVYDAKCMIFSVLKPLIKICKVNEENIAEVKKAFEDLAFSSGRTVMKNIKEKVLTYKKLDKPMTVCTNPKCCKHERILENGLSVLKNIYEPVCCKDCSVPFISYEAPGSFFLFVCGAMSFGKCKVCTHPKNEHMHVTYELSEAEKLFKIETKDIKTREKELESELKIIIDTLAFFSQYLKKFALMSDEGDPVTRYIDEEIRKANESLGSAVQSQADIHEVLKAKEIIEKDKLKVIIKNNEHDLGIIRKCKKTYADIVQLREDQMMVDGFHCLDAPLYFNDSERLQELERHLRIDMAMHQTGTEEEHMDIIRVKEMSVREILDEKKKEYQMLVDLENLQETARDLGLLLDGLKKITNMYNEKLQSNSADVNPTPRQVTERINKLRKLNHNGKTFDDIYSNILELRKQQTRKKPKIWKLKFDNIPNNPFSSSKRPVEL